MPFELFHVAAGGTLVRHRSVIRRTALTGALRRADTPTVGIDINDLTVAGVSPHLVTDELVGLGFEEVSSRLNPAYRQRSTVAAPIDISPANASLRLAGMAEVLGSMLVFGSIFALIVGTLVVADTSFPRAEKTLAHLGVGLSVAALVGLGVLLRATAILLRRGLDNP